MVTSRKPLYCPSAVCNTGQYILGTPSREFCNQGRQTAVKPDLFVSDISASDPVQDSVLLESVGLGTAVYRGSVPQGKCQGRAAGIAVTHLTCIYATAGCNLSQDTVHPAFALPVDTPSQETVRQKFGHDKFADYGGFTAL